MINIYPHDNRICVQAPFVLKDTCKNLYGARWDKDNKVWTYPATPLAAQQIRETFAPLGVRFDPEIIKLENQLIKIEYIKSHPDQLESIPHIKTLPWQHQLQAYHLIQESPAALLALDMGTGKSKVIIDFICNNDDIQTVLIVCPRSVISVWPSEFAKHAWPHATLNIIPLLDGSVHKRAHYAELQLKCARPDQTTIIICNYEAIWQGDLGKLAAKQEWDMVVCDEAHRIKSYKSVASKFIARLKAKRRVCLTGTPFPHSPLDVFGQYRFLDPSIYGMSFTAFRSRYAVMGGYGNHEVKRFQNLDDLNRKFYSIALRVNKEDVLDLPDTVDEERQIVLNDATRKIYDDMEDDFITEMEAGTIVASNALAKLLRLQQITSGFGVTDDDKTISLDSGKADTLLELCEDIPVDKPIVVFARFRHDLAVIAQIAAKAKRTAYELSGKINQLADWQADNTGSVLAVQIQAGGVGIDLTRANYCVYFSLSWSLGEYLQSKARLHRPGQTNKVTFIHLLAAGTVDEKMYQALKDKREVIEAVLKELQPHREHITVG